MSKAAVWTGVVAAALAWCAGGALAQPGAGVQLALDRPVDLSIASAPIKEVFDRITEAAGVRFVLGPDVYACLPYGDRTCLAIKLKTPSLRKALSPMLAKQGMDWIVENDAVRIVPTASLLRMNRRATYEELGVLGQILSVRLELVDKGGAVIDQLRKVTGDKELKLVFHPKAETTEAATRADLSLPCTGAQWLDMLCHGRGWTWYIWGDDVVIVEQKTQIKRQLQQTVSLRYESADLTTVLLDLAHKARVQLNMDPGVMEYVPVETRRNFNLIMSDATLAQALEVISGATGLKFVIENEGIRVEASDKLRSAAEQTTGATTKKTPFFLKTALPLADGSTVEVYIRADDLPPDVQAGINAVRAKLIEQIREKYAVTTQPATQPAK